MKLKLIFLLSLFVNVKFVFSGNIEPTGFSGEHYVLVPDETSTYENKKEPKFKKLKEIEIGDKVLCLESMKAKPSWGVVVAKQKYVAEKHHSRIVEYSNHGLNSLSDDSLFTCRNQNIYTKEYYLCHPVTEIKNHELISYRDFYPNFY